MLFCEKKACTQEGCVLGRKRMASLRAAPNTWLAAVACVGLTFSAKGSGLPGQHQARQ